MTNERKGLQNTLNSAKEALEKINADKFPKLYASKQGEIKALEIAIDKETWAKKVEKSVKEKETITPKKEGEGTPKIPSYSLKDAVVLSNALKDVHEDDIDFVEKWANDNKVSIAEAKNNEDVKAVLRNREEHRKTAQAANTGGSKRGTSKTSGQELLNRFTDKEELPESDEEMDKLVEARLQSKTRRQE